MFHNTLYRLERGQKTCLLTLGILFLILSAIWLIFEYKNVQFPMEPIVVFVGGSATLFASYWPWRPTHKSSKLKGRVSFDYEKCNNGLFEIGDAKSTFTLKFSSASGDAIHFYSDPPDIEKIAKVPKAGRFEEVRDASSLNFGERAITLNEGDMVSIMNKNKNYALMQIHDVKYARHGDKCDEVTFSYVINQSGEHDFS